MQASPANSDTAWEASSTRLRSPTAPPMISPQRAPPPSLTPERRMPSVRSPNRRMGPPGTDRRAVSGRSPDKSHPRTPASHDASPDTRAPVPATSGRRTPSAPWPNSRATGARPSALSPEPHNVSNPWATAPLTGSNPWQARAESRRASSLFVSPDKVPMPSIEEQTVAQSPTCVSSPTVHALHEQGPSEGVDEISPTKKRDRRHERRASYVWTNAAGDIDTSRRLSAQLQPGASSPDLTHLISPDPTVKRKVSGQRSTSAAWTTLPQRAVSNSFAPADPPPSPVHMQALPCSMPMLATLAVMDFGLGAVLWVLGQVRDSLALVGFGFLMVFDTLGIINAMLVQRMHRTDASHAQQRPFGVRRFETLLDFTLVVYLLFAGIYMCKENAEHALLASSAPHEEDRAGLSLPVATLGLVWLVCFMTNAVLKNHQRISLACGMSFDGGDTLDGRPQRSHARHVSVLTRPILAAGPLYDALTNPFAVMILFFATVLFVSALLLPPAQSASFDKLLAGLEGTAMMYVSASALRPLSKVLLQAAPPAKEGKASQMHRAVHIIESHPSVVRVTQLQMWQLTLPSLGYTKSGIGTDGKRGLAGIMSMHQTVKSAPVVVTMHIEVKKEASAQDILDVISPSKLHEKASVPWYNGITAMIMIMVIRMVMTIDTAMIIHTVMTTVTATRMITRTAMIRPSRLKRLAHSKHWILVLICTVHRRQHRPK